jgi:LPXTG-site transpeptidase (sortase) family protein
MTASRAPLPRGALIGLVLGVLLTAVPAALWLAGTAPASIARPVAQTGTVPVNPPGPVPTEVVGPSGASAAVAPGEPAVPTRIRLASIDVDAAVEPVGVDGGGEMAVPEDVRTIGWYRFGPGPGADGSTVLAGHVDDRLQGHGAFYRLTDVVAGDPVQVQLSDGRDVRFRVSEVERIEKSQLPTGALFARTGPPRLTLITCGGEFDRVARHFRDNVVIRAVPE